MQKSHSKIIFLTLLLVLGLNLFAVGETFAYFSNTVVISDITFATGTLDFSLRSGQGNFVPTITAENMKPGDSVARDIYIKKEGTLPFKYTAHSESISGSCDEELYDALGLKVWYNWYFEEPSEPNYHESRKMFLKYDGPLKDFDLRDLNPDDSDLQIPGRQHFNNKFYGENEHWFYFQITLPSDAPSTLQNKSCQFKFVFDGWQTNFEDFSQGFSATEGILNTLTTGEWLPKIVINEVYYDVADDGSKGTEAKNEWIELYNNTDQDISLKDWTLTNNAGTKVIHANKPIGAGEFIVISHDNQTCGKYWNCDPNKHINLGESLSEWLNNDGDQLILKDSLGNEIDFVAWEKGYKDSYPDWDIEAEEGESIARKDKEVDTDSVGDWEVLTIPNPGTNPHNTVLKGFEETGIEKNIPSDIEENNEPEEEAAETKLDEGDQQDEPAVETKEEILEKLSGDKNQDSGDTNDGDGNGGGEDANTTKPVDSVQAPE